MATLTLTYPFTSSAQGWVGADRGTGGASSATWQSTQGNPSGSLGFTCGLTGGISWTLSGSWESLGVPSGATVSSVQLVSVDEEAYSVDPSTTLLVGPYNLANSAGTTIVSLLSSRVVSSSETSWTTRNGTSQSISTSQSSSSVIKIIANATVSLGTGAAGLFDNLNININYSGGAIPTYTGSGLLTQSNETLTAQGGSPIYTGSSALSHSNEVLNSSGNFISSIYTGTALLSHSNENLVPTQSMDGGLDVAPLDKNNPNDIGIRVYLESNEFFVEVDYSRTDASLIHQSQLLSSAGSFIQPIYSGDCNIIQSRFISDIQGSNPSGPIFGSANLVHRSQVINSSGGSPFHNFLSNTLNLFVRGILPPSFTQIDNNISLFIYGDVISQLRPHGAAGFIFDNLDLYIAGISNSGIGEGKLNLYISGITASLGNYITLYLCNNTTLIGKNTTLFISGAGLNPGFFPINSNIPLFIEGGGSNIVVPGSSNNTIPLFVKGTTSSANLVSNATTLFVKVAEGNLLSDSITLYISGQNVGFESNTITMVIPYTKMVGSIPLYIHGF